MHILLIEDNESIIKGLTYTLEKNNYKVTSKMRAEEATLYLKIQEDIDLILLDITLPDGNGFALFEEEIKKRKINTIFLTVKEEEDDIVKGLDMGAEDYITKPFSTKELLARINKVLRQKRKDLVIKVKDITYDMNKMELYKEEKKISLTPLELKIVNLLFTNLEKVVTRNILLDKIWEWTGNDVDDHTITVYLKRIREKIKTDIIKTIKGVGYRIDAE